MSAKAWDKAYSIMDQDSDLNAYGLRPLGTLDSTTDEPLLPVLDICTAIIMFHELYAIVYLVNQKRTHRINYEGKDDYTISQEILDLE